MTAEPTQRRYLVATDDGQDPDYTACRRAGIELAKRDDASVVLYDRSAESLMVDPYPVGPWSDEDDAVSAESRLDPETLQSLGRGYLADQLEETRAEGVQAEAYLGQGTGADALRRAVDRYEPSLVVLPASIRRSSLLDKVRHNTWEDFVESIDVDVQLVDSDGDLL